MHSQEISNALSTSRLKNVETLCWDAKTVWQQISSWRARNSKTQTAKAVQTIKRNNQLLLTGGPQMLTTSNLSCCCAAVHQVWQSCYMKTAKHQHQFVPRKVLYNQQMSHQTYQCMKSASCVHETWHPVHHPPQLSTLLSFNHTSNAFIITLNDKSHVKHQLQDVTDTLEKFTEICDSSLEHHILNTIC